MVAGDHATLFLTIVTVDRDGGGSVRKRWRGEQQVDAKAYVLVEVAAPVVPPLKLLEIGIEGAE